MSTKNKIQNEVRPVSWQVWYTPPHLDLRRLADVATTAYFVSTIMGVRVAEPGGSCDRQNGAAGCQTECYRAHFDITCRHLLPVRPGNAGNAETLVISSVLNWQEVHTVRFGEASRVFEKVGQVQE